MPRGPLLVRLNAFSSADATRGQRSCPVRVTWLSLDPCAARGGDVGGTRRVPVDRRDDAPDARRPWPAVGAAFTARAPLAAVPPEPPLQVRRPLSSAARRR